MDSNKLLNVHCLEEILPESICLNLRAELASKELSCKELSHESQINSFDLTKNSTDTGKFVVDLPGIGTVDRNGLQDTIKLHNHTNVMFRKINNNAAQNQYIPRKSFSYNEISFNIFAG
jgi:hypothetical protein